MRLCLRLTALLLAACAILPRSADAKPLTSYVDPFLGTTAPSSVAEVGFKAPWKVWGGLTFPGSSLPNAMVQLSPITRFKSGAGYEYEDNTIVGFAHTNKGHWNLCNLPVMPASGRVNPNNFESPFSHKNESASPGYYQVLLSRNNINVELTATLRCGFHRHTYKDGRTKKLIVNLAVSNEQVKGWKIEQVAENAFQGFQQARDKIFFYATTSRKIEKIEMHSGREHKLPVINFDGDDQTLEIKIGLSFVSAENARINLEAEIAGKSFDDIRTAATETWEALLSKIRVTGGSERQRGMFYSCLYRSFLWPALRSDTNGEFKNPKGKTVRADHAYYTDPSLWDDYRNKLVLLGMLAPKVVEDVIQSMIERGNASGFMPIFFHGDHAAPFIAGSYLRGLRGYDVKRAYELLLTNATRESNRGRPHLNEYINKGYISTPRVGDPGVEIKAKAGVTKTLEYAYDDYSLALLAREMSDDATYQTMMKRSRNYANLFDPETGLMRGRLEDGSWVRPFDAKQPYYEYMYREANAWQSSFFVPHDTEGLIALYPDKTAFERQLDRLFTTPWSPRHIARNVNTFIGQYCHGNQPDHGFPYLYYWTNHQEKCQILLNIIMERFYGMSDGRTLCGMDDAGEMSSWYVFNAIGLYPYSPADPDYIITVPFFDEVRMQLGGQAVTITRGAGDPRITEIIYDGEKLQGWFITHDKLLRGKTLHIKTAPVVVKK
jgi:predicted alpha-1,2-mannosidase